MRQDLPPADRRGTERRRAERRRSQRRGPDAGADAQASWFGPSQGDTDWGGLAHEAPEGAGGDSQFFFQPARHLHGDASGDAFQRLYRAFLGARAALGLALAATQLMARAFGTLAPDWLLGLSVGYAAQALGLWLWSNFVQAGAARQLARLTGWQWLLSIGFDLALFGALHMLDAGSGLSFAALFIMPVLMAGVLTPRLFALATAALATLVLLGAALWSLAHGVDAGLRLTQAGLVGSGFFVVSLLASELASRLAREEQSARGSMELARQQAELNRLVIDEMQEGVLVVDRRGRVRAANPAARALLSDGGMVRTAPFQLRGVLAWAPLVAAVERAFAEGVWPEAGRDVQLEFHVALQRSLRVRMRFTRRRESDASEDLCVLFVEDNRNVQARSRQEKLAAMGRVSAGIAHEIRNPLAAIAQANALLAEDGLDARSAQLTGMVASNVQRLKRIVDDVMEVAPGVVPEPMPVNASELVAQVCQDWARTNGLELAPRSELLRVELAEHAIQVSFEPEHLRRILVNLLDNGLRHAHELPGAVQVSLRAQSEQWAVLSVLSLGDAIPPDVERHLFEPFFSTRSRGSGLGLYICRELCERYGGRIEYARRVELEPPGNEFSVILKRVAAHAVPT
ncbi:ATP-binding protein [Paucibacter sediminis]|uniref:histidine kinase n=1 Tax=Paucibacter sediminis TaxID=3019553 RepID=A0AA95NBR9_9BURK|nr:ATP-binding protein [Paucibacter sp. S2-9]WIT09872.1 ATP-binding protein [Paucibacter sp. S2-9]